MAKRLRAGELILTGAILFAGEGASAQLTAGSPTKHDAAFTDEGEIIVTAQRRNERLQDVPVAVQAFSTEQLATVGIQSAADLPILAPSLTFAAQAGWAQPRLRGVGTSALGPGIESPVAAYVDGVYYASMAGGTLDLVNIEAVEVLNGPQGTLFGRNATGGLIQVRTADPKQEFGGLINATYGNYDTAGVTTYFTGGVTKTLSADFSLSYSDQGKGYGTNLFTGTEVEKTDSLFIRTKWLLDLDTTKVTMAADYGYMTFMPVLAPAPGTTPIGAPPFTGPARSLDGVYDPDGKITQGGGSLKIDHDFGGVRLVSISAYRETHYFSVIDGALTPIIDLVLNIAPREPHAQFSQEVQLLSDKSSRIEWIVGAYYFHERSKFDPLLVYGGILSPLYSIATYADAKTDTGSIYGQATIDLGQNTRLTVGARYSIERRKIAILDLIRLPDDTLVDAPFDAGKKTFKKPTWRLAIDHKFTPDVMAYASYNRGFKSGGFNTVFIPVIEFDPEVLDAWEVGVKSAFLGNRAHLNLAAFYYDYKNMQMVSYKTGLPFYFNGAKAELYGLDADFSIRPAQRLTLHAGGSLLKTKFKSFPNADITTPAPGGGTLYDVGSVKGNELPVAPDWTLNASADYVLPTSVGDVAFNVTYLHNDGWFGEPDNRLRQPAYDVINAQVSWTSSDELTLVRLWGRNLTDEDYAATLFSQFNGDVIQYTPPRTYGVTVERRF